MLFFNKDDLLIVFNLKLGMLIDIFEPPQPVLSVTVLPFSLSSACYAFTKLIMPQLDTGEHKGYKLSYLDNGIVVPGLLVNESKSQWEIVKKLIWLGFE